MKKNEAIDIAKGRGMDFSTFSVFDVSTQPFEQVATYRDSMISPMLFPDIINKYVRAYNEALVIIETCTRFLAQFTLFNHLFKKRTWSIFIVI